MKSSPLKQMLCLFCFLFLSCSAIGNPAVKATFPELSEIEILRDRLLLNQQAQEKLLKELKSNSDSLLLARDELKEASKVLNQYKLSTTENFYSSQARINFETVQKKLKALENNAVKLNGELQGLEIRSNLLKAKYEKIIDSELSGKEEEKLPNSRINTLAKSIVPRRIFENNDQITSSKEITTAVRVFESTVYVEVVHKEETKDISTETVTERSSKISYSFALGSIDSVDQYKNSKIVVLTIPTKAVVAKVKESLLNEWFKNKLNRHDFLNQENSPTSEVLELILEFDSVESANGFIDYLEMLLPLAQNS